MNSLSGTRVIIVDDDEDDALPVLKAFARKGIPTSYFDGTVNELPAKKNALTGVRLAILDMDLIGGATSKKAKAAALVARLERILATNNGPYIALLWTNQPELRELFESYSFSSKSLPNPILTVLLTKAECKSASGKFKLSVVSKSLELTLAQASPLQVLQVWEEKSFKAATDVTNSLSRLAEPATTNLDDWRTEWKSQLLNLMHAMAIADMGTNLESACCTDALFNALNPLHADRVESYSSRHSPSLAASSDEIINAPSTITTRQKAEVNTMLHLAFDNLSRFSPGNIYVFAQKTVPSWLASNKELASDIAQNEKKLVANASRRVLIESSAVCDHAQGNIRVHRFIAGLLVPVDQFKKMKSAPFIFVFGPLHLKRPVSSKEGDFYLYFSARHQVTRAKNELNKMIAVARLRAQAFSNIQAWYSSQSARPGVVTLT